MSKATFYTHVARPAEFAVRLSARAVRSGSRVLVWTESSVAADILSRNLWQLEPESFLAHEIWLPDTPAPADCPITVAFGHTLPAVSPDTAVLNLADVFWHQAAPPPARVLEIVGTGLEELAEARERFRAYRTHGFAIEHHNMSGKA